MNKRSIAFLLLGASVALAQGPAFARRGGGPMAGPGGRGGFGEARVVAGSPFSAVEVRTFEEQLATGNAISRTSQTVLYRDSQGRTRTEVTITPAASTGKQPYTMITIADPVARQRYMLDSSTMTYRANRMPTVHPASASGGRGGAKTRPAANAGASPAVRTAPNGAAVTHADLGSQLKNGVLATGTRNTEVIPAGKIGNAQPITVVREIWVSTELKREVEAKVTDPIRGNSTMELTNLVAGEPNAAFFTLPAGYTESKAGRGGRGGFAPGRRGPGAQ